MGLRNKIPKQDYDTIINRYINNEEISDIAKSYNVHYSNISRLIRKKLHIKRLDRINKRKGVCRKCCCLLSELNKAPITGYLCKICYNIYQKDRYEFYKNLVFDHYGRKCFCCGEIIEKFLSIDHINNDGYIHRKILHGGAVRLYRWLVDNNFPLEFRTACMNCNHGRMRNNGVCPHEQQ